jgi:hypothetical protein
VFHSYNIKILYIKITPGDDFGEVIIYNIYNSGQKYGEDAADILSILENIIIINAE